MVELKVELSHSAIYWLIASLKLLKGLQMPRSVKKDIKAYTNMMETEIMKQTGYIFTGKPLKTD